MYIWYVTSIPHPGLVMEKLDLRLAGEKYMGKAPEAGRLRNITCSSLLYIIYMTTGMCLHAHVST